MNKEEYCRKIESLIYYLKSGSTFNTKVTYKKKVDFLNDLKKYIKYHLNDENKVYIDILYKLATSNKDEKSCMFYLKDSYCADYKYIEIIYDVLMAYKNNREEAIDIALKTLNKYTKYPDALKKFNEKFYNAILYKDILDDVLNEVIVRTSNVEEKRTTYLDENALRSTNDELYKKIYDSGMSLLDYAHHNFVDSSAHKNFFNPAGIGCNKELANELLSRKDTCTGELLKVIEMINNGEITDAIDYYRLTKLGPLYLRKIATEYGLSTVNLSKFVSKNKNPFNELYMIEGQIKEKMIINGQEVSDSIKIKAKEEMEELGMPMMAAYHKQFIRKLIKSK